VAAAVAAIVEPDAPPQLPGLVPAWLDRMAQFSWRILVGIALIALLVGIVTTVPLVVIPVVLATIVAATLEPLAEMLIERGQSRATAAAAAVGGGFFAVAAVLLLAMVALVDQAGELGDIVVFGADSANESLGGILDLPVQAVSTGAQTTVEAILALAQTLGPLVVFAVISALLSYYFLRDGGRLWTVVVSHVRAGVLADAQAAGSHAFSVLGGYMVGTAVISFVGAASQLVIMVVLGLPLALPVFVLSFFLSFIPYIGGFISTLIAFLIAVAVGSPADILIMFIWTIVFNLVTGSIVAPIVYGKTVHIHPAIVLAAIPAGGSVAGILGMFIVVPALGVVAVSWRTVLEVMASRGTSAEPIPAPLPSPPSAPVEAVDSS
jgi:predicted PurR-regulated permease PerM